MLLSVDTTDEITNAKIEKLRAEQEKTRAAIAEAEGELEQLEHKAARLKQSQSKEERAARTRRLIERGAIAESFVPNAAALTNDEFKAALKQAFRATS
jgi:regulator of protease activity HflC (stomatin/prohibitin superfamily)